MIHQCFIHNKSWSIFKLRKELGLECLLGGSLRDLLVRIQQLAVLVDPGRQVWGLTHGVIDRRLLPCGQPTTVANGWGDVLFPMSTIVYVEIDVHGSCFLNGCGNGLHSYYNQIIYYQYF